MSLWYAEDTEVEEIFSVFCPDEMVKFILQVSLEKLWMGCLLHGSVAMFLSLRLYIGFVLAASYFFCLT